MTPQAERSEYHDHPPVLHDLEYVIRDGVPVLLNRPEKTDD